MVLGLTNGITNYGLSNYSGGSNNAATYYVNVYGHAVSSSAISDVGKQPSNHIGMGVTQDPTKSGLIVIFSGLTLGTVTSLKLGNYYIRY